MRKILVTITIMFATSAMLSGFLWYRLNGTSKQLTDTEVLLANTRVELGVAEERLSTTKTKLDATETQLTDTETQVNETEEKLDATEFQLTKSKTQLNIANQELASAEKELEIKTSENNRVRSQYAELRNEVNTRLGLTSRDRQSFITPGNAAISAITREITGGYSGDVSEVWRDFERLYRWVVNNISYSYDSYTPLLPEEISDELVWWQEYWRLPEETLMDETGDCEDMALLLASMLRSYNEGRYEVWVLMVSSSVPDVDGHVAVAFPVQDGRLAILDPAGNWYTGYSYGVLESESAPVAVNQWLSHLETEIPGAKIVGLLSESADNHFLDTAEFLTWLQE